MTRTPQEIFQHHAQALGAVDLDEIVAYTLQHTSCAGVFSANYVNQKRLRGRSRWTCRAIVPDRPAARPN